MEASKLDTLDIRCGQGAISLTCRKRADQDRDIRAQSTCSDFECGRNEIEEFVSSGPCVVVVHAAQDDRSCISTGSGN